MEALEQRGTWSSCHLRRSLWRDGEQQRTVNRSGRKGTCQWSRGQMKRPDRSTWQWRQRGRMARPTAAQQLDPSGLEADWMPGVMQNWSLGRRRVSWGTYRGKLLLILMKITTRTVLIGVYSALTYTEPWLHTVPNPYAEGFQRESSFFRL